MLSLAYDLHIHSCLSPCGDNEATPSNIVGMAYVKGLDVIALTDHNTAKNCPAALKTAEALGVTLICGMELCTSEEIHVVCLLPSLDAALELDQLVHSRLMPIKNRPKLFGEQLICNEDDVVTGTEELMLIAASDISFDEAFPLVEGYGGVAFPAHIDKSANSLLATLGAVPPDSSFKSAEIAFKEHIPELLRLHTHLRSCTLLHNSDAHTIGDISEPVSFLHAEARTPEAIIEALKAGRHVKPKP